MYFVYMIECKDGSIYTGITTDLGRRLEEHKKGMGARYTRSRKVNKLLYSEKKWNRSTASRREAEIKSWTREKKMRLVRSKKV